jgi:hypothetical protein
MKRKPCNHDDDACFHPHMCYIIRVGQAPSLGHPPGLPRQWTYQRRLPSAPG